MAERPYVSFAEIKQRIPIPDVLIALGIIDRFSRKKDTLTGVCPLPSHQHGPHPNAEQFKINQRDGLWLWHCFGDCQRGGDVIEFVKAMTGYDDAHVRFWFAEKFADRLTLQQHRAAAHKTSQTSETSETPKTTTAIAIPTKDSSQEPSAIPPAMPAVAPPLKPLRFFLSLNPDVPYLFERGLKPDTIRRFGIGLCRKGLLAGYVAIPVYDYPRTAGTNPVGYLGRWPGEPSALDDQNEPPRYKFPESFPRNRVIYGLAEALDDCEGRPLIVVEGPFKVYHLFQAGFPNSVATFGASISDEQVAILVSTGRPLILLSDGDDAGQAGMQSAAERLVSQAFVRVVRLQPGEHPDHLSPAELRRILP